MDRLSIDVNETVRVSGGVDVRIQNPPKQEPSFGVGSLLVAAGIGALVSFFANKKPKQIVHIHQVPSPPVQERKSDAFKFSFRILDRAKNILRSGNSEEIKEDFFEIIEITVNFIFNNSKSFSQFEVDVITSQLNDIVNLMNKEKS